MERSRTDTRAWEEGFMRTRAWAPLVVLLGVCRPVGGTDLYFPDLDVRSADGKLRLVARSPDNAKGENQPFARRFVYKLSEARTGRLVWERKQGKREASPIRLFVHNGGRSIIRTGGDVLLLLDARGVVVHRFDILAEGLPAGDVKRYVRETTAGPLWADYSYWYFFESGGQSYFAFRTWWDRRVVLSLEKARPIRQGAALTKAADAAERAFVLDTLRAGARVARRWAAKKLPEYSHGEPGPWDGVERLFNAVHLAGRMKLKVAAPLLRQLEPIPSFDTSGSASETVPDGGLFLASSRWDPMRQQVQLALRRLGERPAGYPVREVMLKPAGSDQEIPYHPPKQAAPRANRVRLVNRNLTPRKVVDAIGEPDYKLRPAAGDPDADWVWEYDIDSEKPYTLRIVWLGQKALSIKRVEPPTWKDSDTRDLQD
jgi:hypothetical protein